MAEAPAVPVVLMEATWLAAPHRWFWGCGKCPRAFGPLATRDVAVAGAREHISEAHDGYPADTRLRTADEMGVRGEEERDA